MEWKGSIKNEKILETLRPLIPLGLFFFFFPHGKEMLFFLFWGVFIYFRPGSFLIFFFPTHKYPKNIKLPPYLYFLPPTFTTQESFPPVLASFFLWVFRMGCLKYCVICFYVLFSFFLISFLKFPFFWWGGKKKIKTSMLYRTFSQNYPKGTPTPFHLTTVAIFPLF